MSSTINKQQMRDILTTITRVSRGDYETRVETTGKHNDFDSIAAGLNMMINEIRSRQEDLEEQREEINALNASLIKEMDERQQAESLYKTLTDNTSTGVYIVQHRHIVFFNNQFQLSNGFTQEELLGMDPLDLVHPDDRERVRKCAVDTLKGNRTHPYEFRIITKFGETLWSMESVASIEYNGARATMGNFVNITEQKNIERQIQESNEQLDAQNDKLQAQAKQLLAQQKELVEKNKEVEHANQLKSEFLASMSHELRTPLNAVIGFSELMLDGITGELNDEQKECLSDILNSGQHLLELINDVLDLSKVEVGKMEFKPVNLAIAEVVNEAIQTVRPMIEDKEHTVEIDIEKELPHIYADKSRLRQVLLNLLSNATKFTPHGGTLGIKAGKKDGFCQVRVIDNGIGLKKEDQERIFEVFTQAETIHDETPKGTGLGLTLTRQFLAAMGGEIWVESEYGKGSTFVFTIPLVSVTEPQPEATAKKKVSKKSKVPRASRDKMLVLLVDDDSKARRLFGAWLKQENYDIAEASNADDGVKQAEELLPDVIVLDILMPEKDGWYALRELKSKAKTSAIPVVIASVGEEREMALSLGAVDYFNKPINKKRFQKRISELGIDRHDRVLVVDDNPADVRLVSSMLESAGIEVLQASGGREGIELILNEKPSLMVLDILMPDLTGFEVIERLRETEGDIDIPIIVITSKDLTDEEMKYLRRQTEGIVKKSSFSREDFVATVKKLIGTHGG